MKVSVLGSGAGALSVAAAFSAKGHEVTLADLPAFEENLSPIRKRGGIEVVSEWEASPFFFAVEVGDSVPDIVRSSELIMVVVPCFGHSAFVDSMMPALQAGQSLIFFGEGSGSLVAFDALGKHEKSGIRVGEANTLPYLARLIAPGTIKATRKHGGVFLSSIPSGEAQGLLKFIQDIWPYISPAHSVWETVLLNFNAIDHVPTMLCNVGTLENRRGRMLLWGEGASRSVVSLIEAVDYEILQIRLALGLPNRGRYRDFLIQQGLAPDSDKQLYEIIESSVFSQLSVKTGDEAMQSRFLTEDVPFGLVLIASIADEVAIETPVIDALIALTSVVLGSDLRSEGRHLARFGLSGAGRDGLLAFAESGQLPNPQP